MLREIKKERNPPQQRKQGKEEKHQQRKREGRERREGRHRDKQYDRDRNREHDRGDKGHRESKIKISNKNEKVLQNLTTDLPSGSHHGQSNTKKRRKKTKVGGTEGRSKDRGRGHAAVLGPVEEDQSGRDG